MQLFAENRIEEAFSVLADKPVRHDEAPWFNMSVRMTRIMLETITPQVSPHPTDAVMEMRRFVRGLPHVDLMGNTPGVGPQSSIDVQLTVLLKNVIARTVGDEGLLFVGDELDGRFRSFTDFMVEAHREVRRHAADYFGRVMYRNRKKFHRTFNGVFPQHAYHDMASVIADGIWTNTSPDDIYKTMHSKLSS
jgi:hypothetical protein